MRYSCISYIFQLYHEYSVEINIASSETNKSDGSWRDRTTNGQLNFSVIFVSYYTLFGLLKNFNSYAYE